jgi:hypothetical protein
MGKMAISAYAAPDNAMHISLFEKFINVPMTAQTKRIYIIAEQLIMVACVHIMTGAALALFKGEMDIFPG